MLSKDIKRPPGSMPLLATIRNILLESPAPLLNARRARGESVTFSTGLRPGGFQIHRPLPYAVDSREGAKSG